MNNVCKLGIILLASMGARAQDTTTNSYTQTNLVSDIAGASHTDTHLKNPWGLSRTTGSYWWVSDNDTGVSTLYDGSGTVESLVVTIPTASGTGKGSPTGTVALGSSFVFVTLDGTISQWKSGTKATIKVNNSSKGAVYTGCTVAKDGTAQQLYVANSNGTVEAYSSTFEPVTLPPGAFVDPNIPVGYTPYGIQAVGAKIYVTFAAQSQGSGKGYVDVFDPTGTLLLRLQHGKWMDQPWGIAMAPANFGAFSKRILVGNVGSGTITAFNPSTGTFVGALDDADGFAITIPGLWALYFGNGGLAGPTTTLYFAAGINGYADGLFGSITAN